MSKDLLSSDDRAFVDDAVARHHAKLLPFSINEPRLVRAVRIMAEQEGVSSTRIAAVFGKGRGAVIGLAARAKPPIRLPGATWGSKPSVGGLRRKHVKAADGDLTASTKYARLVGVINRTKEARRLKIKQAQLQPLTVPCPDCGAVEGEGCYTVRNDMKVPTRRHRARMSALRKKGDEPKTKAQTAEEMAKQVNDRLGLPPVESRRPNFIQRHMAFNRFSVGGLPNCGWSGCSEQVVAQNKPYCSAHHQQAYGKAPRCEPVNVKW